ncbi:MAG: hypothetical protein ABI776_04630 [Nocardioidaceae bacterium]
MVTDPRTGRGWPGRLLLAAAFGVLMPTWVDLSLWIPQTTEEIPLWADIRAVKGLLPEARGRPWLGWFGITVLTVMAVGVAALVHVDEDSAEAQTSMAKYTLSLAFAATLAAAAFCSARALASRRCPSRCVRSLARALDRHQGLLALTQPAYPRAGLGQERR